MSEKSIYGQILDQLDMAIRLKKTVILDCRTAVELRGYIKLLEEIHSSDQTRIDDVERMNEKLRLEKANLELAQRWIPVSERLPGSFERVLTLKDKKIYDGFVIGATHWMLRPPEADSTLNELRGIAPGITGDLSSEDFVRKVRGEWEESDDANHELGLEPPQVREVFNRRMADGTFRKLAGFFDREDSGE